MWPFRVKQRVRLEAFCKDFYDRLIYHPMIGETDAESAAIWDEFIADLTPSGGHPIERKAFHREMTAIYFELFGLAWYHELKRDKYMIPQSVFTKQYLEEKGGKDLWEAMAEYNQAVAQSHEYIPIRGERMRRRTLEMDVSMRDGVFEKWVKAGVDEVCVARATNRIGTHLTVDAAYLLLADKLASRLRTEFEETFALTHAFRGLYEGARESIKSVRVEP